jgi:hypothetical protein
MKDIAISLPEKALKQVNQWVDASGVPMDRFYSEALIMGARIIAISAPSDALAELSAENMEYISESANSGVTPKAMLQIITEANSRTLLDGTEEPMTELVVNLQDDLFKQFGDHANDIGMQREKYFSLAFAMGARLNSMNNPWKG